METRGQRWFNSCGSGARSAAGPNAFTDLREKCFTIAEEEEKTDLIEALQTKCCACKSCPDCCAIKATDAVDSDVMNVVLKDIPRTYGNNLGRFDTEENRLALTEILVMFSVFKPSVSYTQGMNFIGAVALGHMCKEDAFWFLVELVELLPESFFRLAASEEVELFVDIVSNFAPVVRHHLESSCPFGDEETFERGMGYLLVQWMVPLFVHVLPLETTLHVWDYIFESGRTESSLDSPSLILKLHRIAFALVEVHSGPLLSRHFEAGKAFSSLRSQQSFASIESVESSVGSQSEEEALAYSQLANSLESTSGISFVQRIIASANKDQNYKRIIRLAKELTIDEKWLNQARVAHVLRKSRSGTPDSTLSSCTALSQTNESAAVSETESRPVSVSDFETKSFTPPPAFLGAANGHPPSAFAVPPGQWYSEEWARRRLVETQSQVDGSFQFESVLGCIGREKGLRKKSTSKSESSDDCVVS